jgi:Mn2+/Fe2+ NRAMP family transporter
MNKEEWNKTSTEQNAKAEQIGMGIAIIWFVGFFIALPLCILFPPLIVPIVLGIIWVIMTYRKNNPKKR